MTFFSDSPEAGSVLPVTPLNKLLSLLFNPVTAGCDTLCWGCLDISR